MIISEIRPNNCTKIVLWQRDKAFFSVCGLKNIFSLIYGIKSIMFSLEIWLSNIFDNGIWYTLESSNVKCIVNPVI